jgi:pimeloyl-ACP methyl ester carboxylesterase
VWDAFLDELACHHSVYAPEHPGTSPGDPDAVRAIDCLWDLVLYYYELLDGLGLESPGVVGYSFGGMVAAELAADEPRRASASSCSSTRSVMWRDERATVRNWMLPAAGGAPARKLLRP